VLPRIYIACFKQYHNSEIIFDPSDPVIDESQFEEKDWIVTELCLNTKEDLPFNMPMLPGLGFVMRACVDADLAGDSITHQSRTGFLVYLNMLSIYRMSK